MRYVKWTLIALAVVVVGGFLHWSLPSRDIVRIVDTEVRRTEVANGSDGEVTPTRDVRMISAMSPSDRPRVYRNEDTGFGWPPYFKFDSANLTARAQDAVSTEAEPRWFIVTHYGWRLPLFSAFPNALDINPADGPDQRLVPWFNIIVLVVLAGLGFLLWRQVGRLVARFRR